MRDEALEVVGVPRIQTASRFPITRSHIFTHVVLIAGALLMLYPVLWMLSASFKPSDEIFSDPSL